MEGHNTRLSPTQQTAGFQTIDARSELSRWSLKKFNFLKRGN